MSSKNTQLILGFTGGIGRATALALSNRDIPVKVLVRDKEKAKKFAEGINNIEIIQGNADDAGDLDKAFEDISVVYYCVNVPYPQWEKSALSMFGKTVDAAVKHKVKLIFPGNVYVYGHAEYNPVDEKHPHAAHTKKGRIRIEMERLMESAKKERGLNYTIVRMPDFYGPFVINTFSEQLYINALKGKTLQWIGDLDVEVELIYIVDGGEAMVSAALSDKSNGEVYNIPGSQITTARKYLGEIISSANSKSKITTINSDLLFKIMGFFNTLILEVYEMLYLKREKLILDGSKFEKEIGPLSTTTYASGIKETLSWAKNYFGLK